MTGITKEKKLRLTGVENSGDVVADIAEGFSKPEFTDHADTTSISTWFYCI